MRKSVVRICSQAHKVPVQLSWLEHLISTCNDWLNMRKSVVRIRSQASIVIACVAQLVRAPHQYAFLQLVHLSQLKHLISMHFLIACVAQLVRAPHQYTFFHLHTPCKPVLTYGCINHFNMRIAQLVRAEHLICMQPFLFLKFHAHYQLPCNLCLLLGA